MINEKSRGKLDGQANGATARVRGPIWSPKFMALHANLIPLGDLASLTQPMTRYLLLGLALLLFAAAALFPTQEIDARRTVNLDEMRSEFAVEASRLKPIDDTYVGIANTPYPINTTRLFSGLLFLDGILLIVLAVVAPRFQRKQGADSRFWSTVRGEWPIILLLSAIAALLRIVGSSRDLWIDEITTLVFMARGSFIDIFTRAATSNNHLLNSFLSSVSLEIFGEHAWSLRLPAIIFGTATIPVLYLMVRRFSPRVEAALASFILTLSYHHIFYSQDARGYTAMLFGGLLATLALIEGLEHRSPWAWVVYCGGMLICVGSVAIGSVVLAGHFLAVTFLRPNRAFYVVFAITTWLLLHFYFFVIPDILGFIFGDYTRPEGGWHFSGAFVDAIQRGLRLGLLSVPVLTAEAILVAIGIWSYVRQDRLFAALLLGPEIILLLLLVFLGVAFEPRFFIYVLPVVIVFTARGTRCVIDMLSSRLQFWSYAAAFTCVLAVSIFLLRTWWRFPMQDFVGARQYVEKHLRGGDAIVAIGMAGAGYHFYYWPQIAVENRVSGLIDVMRGSPRVWLLYTFAPDMDQRRPKLMRFVLDHFIERGVFPGRVVDGDVHVRLYTRTDMSDQAN